MANHRVKRTKIWASRVSIQCIWSTFVLLTVKCSSSLWGHSVHLQVTKQSIKVPGPLVFLYKAVEMYRQILDRGEPGDQIGVLLRGVKRDEVRRGQVLAAPKSVSMYNHFAAQVCEHIPVLNSWLTLCYKHFSK